MYDLLLHGVRSGMEPLENGDTIMVPPMGPQVTIEGMVRRPAIYELKDEKDLASALELAGGMLPTAALRHIEVQRLVAHEKHTMLSLDLPDAADPARSRAKSSLSRFRTATRIRIFPIAGLQRGCRLPRRPRGAPGTIFLPSGYARHRRDRLL